MNILLVEDDQLLKKALSNLLTTEGHVVLEARNGKEALDIVLENAINKIRLAIVAVENTFKTGAKDDKIKKDKAGK